MRKILAMTTAALLLTLPAPLLAQHHGGGGHPAGGGGGGGGHGGGGGFHGGGGGHPGGGGGFHGGGGGFHGGGGMHQGGSGHFGAEHRQAVGNPGGVGHLGNVSHGNGNVVINNNNRTFVHNDAFRGGGGRANFAGGQGGHFGRGGLPAGPPRGGWHSGWYGGHVEGFRPIHAGFYRYPSGFGYRRWGIGLVLPAVLFGSAYYYSNWHTLGAYPPPPGDRWVRYGPDLLLVNIPTGRVDDAIYGAFY